MRVLYAKNGGALAVEAEKEASFDFLFQHIEFRCGEELTEGDLKTITKLLNWFQCQGQFFDSNRYKITTVTGEKSVSTAWPPY